MKISELMDYLGKLEPSKEICLVANVDNPEDNLSDVACTNLEIWDDGSESVTLFMSRGEDA